MLFSLRGFSFLSVKLLVEVLSRLSKSGDEDKKVKLRDLTEGVVKVSKEVEARISS